MKMPLTHFGPARSFGDALMDSGLLQRRLAGEPVLTGVPLVVHETLRSPGQPLDAGTRGFMEPRFDYDFSGVRIHTGSKAAESARSVNASAYTVGRDVVFGAGYFEPHLREGRHLLAHELAHVVQQGSAVAEPRISPDARAEREADHAAKIVTEGARASVPPLTSCPGGLMAQNIPGTTPASGGPWSSDLLTIIFASDRQNCFGSAFTSGADLYSSCGSPERGKFCQSISVPYEVKFYVDRATQPRPRPFTPPTVRAAFDFVTTSGKQGFKSDQTDSNPKYTKPNDPLTPSFGQNFPIGSAESGTLKVLLELKDSDSGVNLKFDDKIKFEVVPCM